MSNIIIIESNNAYIFIKPKYVKQAISVIVLVTPLIRIFANLLIVSVSLFNVD